MLCETCLFKYMIGTTQDLILSVEEDLTAKLKSNLLLPFAREIKAAGFEGKIPFSELRNLARFDLAYAT